MCVSIRAGPEPWQRAIHEMCSLVIRTARAIKAGLKANAKSADLIKALESMEATAAAGAAFMRDGSVVSDAVGVKFAPNPERAEVGRPALSPLCVQTWLHARERLIQYASRPVFVGSSTR